LLSNYTLSRFVVVVAVVVVDDGFQNCILSRYVVAVVKAVAA
jgi:tetraacyldisaccharide-1-P 4'-kinase